MAYLTAEVDFDDDGTYSTDVSAYVAALDLEFGMMPYERVAGESYASILLRNEDRRFSPENASSPYAGDLRQGIRVRIRYNGANVALLYADGFYPTVGLFGEVECRLKCSGVKRRLERVTSDIGRFENTTAAAVISNILTTVGIPPSLKDAPRLDAFVLDTDALPLADDILAQTGTPQYNITVAGDNYRSSDRVANAYEIIQDVVLAEQGWFWIDRNGRANLVNRHGWNLSNASAPDATFDNTFESGVYIAPADEERNVVAVTCYPNQAAVSRELVYTLPQPVAVGPDQTITFETAVSKRQGQVLTYREIETPQPVFSVGSGSVAVSSLGQRLLIDITAGAAGATLETLDLYAKADNRSEGVTVYARNTQQVVAVGVNELSLDLRALDSVLDAFDIANWTLANRANPNGRFSELSFVRGLAALEDDDAWGVHIGDLVRVVDDQTAHDRNYRVVGHRYQMARDHTVTITHIIEPADQQTMLTLDDATYAALDTAIIGF